VGDATGVGFGVGMGVGAGMGGVDMHAMYRHLSASQLDSAEFILLKVM
jgi:hypothetical protein